MLPRLVYFKPGFLCVPRGSSEDSFPKSSNNYVPLGIVQLIAAGDMFRREESEADIKISSLIAGREF